MVTRKMDWSFLVLRLVLGLTFMAHGSQKLFGAFGGPGPAGVTKMMPALGFHPAVFWAWVLMLAEFVGGFLIVVGLITRLAALGIIVDMAVAIAKVHGKNGFFLEQKIGYEYNILIIAVCLALIIGGAGKVSLDWLFRRRRRAV